VRGLPDPAAVKAMLDRAVAEVDRCPQQDPENPPYLSK